MARVQTKIEPRGLSVTFAVFTLILIAVETVYLIFRMRDIVLYPHSPVLPHWLEIGINIILFSVLFFILFLSCYLSLAVISKAKGYRRAAKLRLSEIMPKSKYPTVTVAIFTFNEPVEMVRQSIEHNYFNIDYPKEKLQLAVCDDSTDEEYWSPLAKYVEELSQKGHKVFLIHRVIRKGRKAGAFNELINHYAETDYVALADADYMFNPDFLERTLPFFYVEENVFAVQTPQFFRNGDNTWISRLSSNIQQWFYNFLGTFKDKDNSFFFCGTCGIIDVQKAKAVQMEEKAITEDLEMSTEAITKHGWVTLYVDEILTHGVGPEMMGQLVGQYMRYSRGNLWSLRQHLADIILSNKMTFKQKVHYFHNNAALMMGVAMLLVILEPFLFLFLDISGPNIPILLTLFLFFLGNLNFYIVYGKSFREFLFHLFFMNVMAFKLTAQFIKGFILNSPGEFIRTAKISSEERSIRKRIKYVFSLFWLEILVIVGLWFVLLYQANLITLDKLSMFLMEVQSQGIIEYILNYDAIDAISSSLFGSIAWITENPKLAGPILVFSYFTFWFLGGFYLTFIGGNKPTVARVTEFVVPTKQDFFGVSTLLDETKKEDEDIRPIFIGSDLLDKKTVKAGEDVRPPSFPEEIDLAFEKEHHIKPMNELKTGEKDAEIRSLVDGILKGHRNLKVETEEKVTSSIDRILEGYKNMKVKETEQIKPAVEKIMEKPRDKGINGYHDKQQSTPVYENPYDLVQNLNTEKTVNSVSELPCTPPEVKYEHFFPGQRDQQLSRDDYEKLYRGSHEEMYKHPREMSRRERRYPDSSFDRYYVPREDEVRYHPQGQERMDEGRHLGRRPVYDRFYEDRGDLERPPEVLRRRRDDRLSHEPRSLEVPLDQRYSEPLRRERRYPDSSFDRYYVPREDEVRYHPQGQERMDEGRHLGRRPVYDRFYEDRGDLERPPEVLRRREDGRPLSQPSDETSNNNEYQRKKRNPPSS